MKRIAFAMVTVLMLATSALAGGDCDQINFFQSSGSVILLHLRCTAAGDASMAFPLDDDMMAELDGSYLYRVGAAPYGAVNFDSDSDLAITDSLGFTPMSATGKGSALIDDTDIRSKITEDQDGGSWYFPVIRADVITLTITGNATANAVHDIVLWADRSPQQKGVK